MVNLRIRCTLDRNLVDPLKTVGSQPRTTKYNFKPLLGMLFFFAAACLPTLSIAQSNPDVKPNTRQEIKQLEDTLGALGQKVDLQQQQIEDLKLDLKRSAEQLQQTKDQLRNMDAVASRSAADAAASLKADSLKESEAIEVKETKEAKEAKETQKRLDTLENPLALRYKNLLLIPGGFLAAETVFRTRNENSDMGSSFGGLPFDGTANANLSEFHASARATRASLALKTKYRNINLTGFYEIDWYGVTAANDNKSNSYSPRQRQLWVRSEFKNGWTLTTGQMWSLLVRHKLGMATGQEDSAPGDLIEGSFILGHVWERQAGFRVVKNFNDKVWLGFSVENPQTTFAATNAPANIFGLQTSSNSTSPSSDVIPFSSGVAAGFSTDLAPDLIAKANFEPGWGHYEVKAIYRFFRTRANGATYNAYGAGIGWSTKSPLTRKLDFVTEGLLGEGIGRYSSGGGPDITVHPDGSPVPIRQLQMSTGFEYRPTLKLSTFVYEGNEYYQRAAYVNSNGLGVGYGSPLANNSQCQVEVPAAGTPTCTAQNRDLNQVIGGFWYRFYTGPYGTLQYGMNYEHMRRNTWHAVGGQPYGQDDIAMTSLRFVLP